MALHSVPEYGPAGAPVGIDPAILRSVPLFRSFADAQLVAVARLFTVHHYRRHQTIFQEGDPGGRLYVLLSGSVAVVRRNADGREMILALLQPTDFFGEMSVFDTAVRSAAVRTVENANVGEMERDDFMQLLDGNPRMGRLLVIALAERLRSANALIGSATSQDIRARLASLLLSLAERFGEPVGNGTRVRLRLTNQEMANMIGTTRETVNRTLNRFWDEHLIDMRSPNLVIVDADGLRALL